MKTSGIYIIRNLLNNKVYVGQSKDILDRFQGHKRNLREGKHSNIHRHKIL